MAGRPEFQPTDEERKQVEALAGYGVPHDQIAVLVRGGIDSDTLEFLSNNIKSDDDYDKTILVLNKLDRISSFFTRLCLEFFFFHGSQQHQK